MNQVDLAFTSAIGQAQLSRCKEVSPLELVELYLERIQRLDPQINSYFTVIAEQALATAKAQTEQLATATSADLPPFFGVPISIKDLTPVAGVPCSYGNRALLGQVATHDSGVVTKIRQAGFIILGKTATSELGSMPYTEPPGFPPTRNPWNLDYTPGGSSGGAAAALAAGLCPIAQGSDGGGSIRGPAFCCGLVGLKPSRGRISHAPVGDRLSGIATQGTFGRTVADAAALLDVMSGYVTGDPYWLPEPEISFREATKMRLGGLRIAFATNLPPIGAAAPACQQAVLDTAQLLENLGHDLDPVELDFSELIEPFTAVWQTAVAASGIPEELLEEVNRWFLARTVGAGLYLQAVSKMQMVARQIVGFFEHYDALLLPTNMSPAIRVGAWANLTPEERLPKIIEWVAPCPPFNATGQPAIAIPTGFTDRNLPVGVQIVGRPAQEIAIIALAAQIEAAQPWRDRRPTLAVE